MRVVFTYIPIRLDSETRIYLNYSITNLNKDNIIPILYSDKDYFKLTSLKYEFRKIEIEDRYLIPNLWSYPKLKVLSQIDYPFIHLDNDLVIKDFLPTFNKIKKIGINLCYKHSLDERKKRVFMELFKKYSTNEISFDELNNTCIISSYDYEKVNLSYKNVIEIIDKNYNEFIIRKNDIPPITLNQQYLNLFFKEINYLFENNPSYNDFDKNGICHIAEKNLVNKFILNKQLI